MKDHAIAHAPAASGAAVADFPALRVFDAEGLIEIVFLTCSSFQMPGMETGTVKLPKALTYMSRMMMPALLTCKNIFRS